MPTRLVRCIVCCLLRNLSSPTSPFCREETDRPALADLDLRLPMGDRAGVGVEERADAGHEQTHIIECVVSTICTFLSGGLLLTNHRSGYIRAHHGALKRRSFRL